MRIVEKVKITELKFRKKKSGKSKKPFSLSEIAKIRFRIVKTRFLTLTGVFNPIELNFLVD